MNRPRLARVLASIPLVAGFAMAQEQPPAAQASQDTKPRDQWSYYGSATGYLIPDGPSYVSPVFAADRKWLHLEARYNYENLRTGSLWLGRNFSVGDKITLGVTPMIGGVFGRSAGIAPGYQATLSYRRLSLDTQGEYLFDVRDRSGNFFYTWSELSYSPVDWFRTGLVIQRTKAYQTDLSVQRGVLAGFTYKQADFTTYVFNFGWTDPTVVFSLGFSF